jgi:hypothetical protein
MQEKQARRGPVYKSAGGFNEARNRETKILTVNQGNGLESVFQAFSDYTTGLGAHLFFARALRRAAHAP